MAVNQTRTSQGGSVVSFVVIGIVLIALVSGGVYLLQHRSGNQIGSPVATTSKAPTPSAGGSKTPAAPPIVTVSPVPAKGGQPPAPATPQKPVAPAPSGTSNMPATGPSDMLPGGAMAAILFGVTVAFIQSRRDRRHLFNQ